MSFKIKIEVVIENTQAYVYEEIIVNLLVKDSSRFGPFDDHTEAMCFAEQRNNWIKQYRMKKNAPRFEFIYPPP